MVEFDITLRADTTELEETEAEWRLRLRRMNLDIQRTKLELRRTQLYAVTVIGSIMSMVTAVAGMLPEPFRFIGISMVNLLQAVLAALTASAAAMSTAAAANPLLIVQAVLGWVAVGIAFIGVMNAVTAQEQINAEMSRLESTMSRMSSSLQGIIHSLGV
jgi:uncharacterized membrane protein YozB (DUF420 family)